MDSLSRQGSACESALSLLHRENREDLHEQQPFFQYQGRGSSSCRAQNNAVIKQDEGMQVCRRSCVALTLVPRVGHMSGKPV